MEITLEKIELVKDRTGVTYAEAKQALEDADGSVVDAIISIEETVNSGEKSRGFGEKGEALFGSLKSLIKKGNVARIQVKRDDGIILNVPVNAGILGICIAPLASVVALVAAFGFKCTIEVVKTDGTIIDVSDAVSDTVATVAEKGSDKADFLREKGKEYYEKAMKSDFVEKAKESEFMDKAVDGVSDFVGKAGEFAEDIAEKIKKSDVAEEAADVAEAVEEAAEEAAETVEEAAEEVVEEAAEAAEEIKDEE